MYKKAIKMKLRFPIKGVLSVEDLFDLKLNELDRLAVGLSDKLENTAKKTFLEEVSKEDEVTKLQLDIVIDVIQTKQIEIKAIKEAQSIKAHNEKILSKIAIQQDKELDNKSIEELQKLLK